MSNVFLNTLEQVKRIARPYWEQLIAECPEVLESDFEFEDFCNEIVLELPA